MREECFGRANPPRRGQRFVKAHVSRMRFGPERVQHGDFNVADLFHDRWRYFLAIAQVREPLPAVLHKEIAVRHGGTVRQGQGSDLKVSQSESSINHVWFRMKITPGNRPAVKGVNKYTFKRRHRFFIGINRQWSAANVTKSPAVVQP